MSAARIPLYLSGAFRRELSGSVFGFMCTPQTPPRKCAAGRTWFADNGCFSARGERAFELEAYLAWLRNQDATTCLGATAPDKVGDAIETIKRSLPVLPLIRSLGYKAAFVAQDGLRLVAGKLVAGSASIAWESFDVLFIGGSTAWKLGSEAAAIALEANARGKWVHMGRVNSYKRYLYAMQIGCDSVDGTFVAFAPTENVARLKSWVKKLRGRFVPVPRQQELFA